MKTPAKQFKAPQVPGQAVDRHGRAHYTVNMKFVTLLPVVLVLFAGCSSLPKPNEGDGLVIIPYYFENTSPYIEPILKYELEFNDGSSETVVPSDGMLVLARKKSFSMQHMKSTLNMQNWTGGENYYSFKVTYTIVPGSIVIADSALVFTQTDAGENNRRYGGSYAFVPLSLDQREAIGAKIKADPNFKYWNLW